MLATFLISLREYLEVFLIIGVFLGISKKLGLGRGKEIFIASAIGISVSFLLPVLTFMAGDRARLFINEESAEAVEGYLMVFSGIFLAYVVLSLHNYFRLARSKAILQAHQKLKSNIFDISLFLTIIFFICREGFEIALFTATTSLFDDFSQNMLGLLAGFAVAGVGGLLTTFAYIKLPIGRVFKVTEYAIILLGAAFVKNGLTELLEVHFDFNLKYVIPLTMSFLPAKETVVGGFLKTFTGIEQNFSVAKLGVMLCYLGAIYLIFYLNKRRTRLQTAHAQT